MFKVIHNISDITDAVAHKKEIKFFKQPNGITLGCYLFMDKDTFDTPEALDCRGICFDARGKVVSRPLHKFFNVGEKEWLLPDAIATRTDIVAVYEKLDGSMIATAWVNDQLTWRSKQSFESEVVRLTEEFLADPKNNHIASFAEQVAADNMTAIFELTHPEARIIVEQAEPQLRLLHVRDNITGSYILLDSSHPVHELIRKYAIPQVAKIHTTEVNSLFTSLSSMRDMEGYVIQFANGDMAKIKCPWYSRLHGAVSMLRERDVAKSALHQELDDLKGALRELNIDLTQVEAVESRLKANLLAIMDEVERVCQQGKDMDRKTFAQSQKEHPLFGLIMLHYSGKEFDLTEWYERKHLKEDFSLRALVSEAMVEALDG